jgi:hypothetical protein
MSEELKKGMKCSATNARNERERERERGSGKIEMQVLL